MKSITLFLLLATIVLFTQCREDDYVWMNYISTKCADPWETNESHSDQIIKNAVEEYMSFLDLPICKIKIYYDSEYAQDCEACSCTSGKIISVKIKEAYVEEFEAEGFVDI